VIVEPLRHHADFVAEFARHFEQEWPDWYGPSGPGSAAQDLAAFANPEGALPVGVMAFSETGQPCGVAALKASSIAEFNHLSPWAAAGYVLPQLRGQGIGAALLAALLVEAKRLGYNSVFCATSTAASLLQRQGWRLLQSTVHDGKPISLFRSPSAAFVAADLLQRASPASASR
jgi:N-acetylglutamate synthase-like GNAT family acetyltransferase